MKKTGIMAEFFILILILAISSSGWVLAQKEAARLPEISEKNMVCSSSRYITEALVLAINASKISAKGEHTLSVVLIRKAAERLERAEKCLGSESLSPDEMKEKNDEIEKYRRRFKEFEKDEEVDAVLDRFLKDVKKEMKKTERR